MLFALLIFSTSVQIKCSVCILAIGCWDNTHTFTRLGPTEPSSDDNVDGMAPIETPAALRIGSRLNRLAMEATFNDKKSQNLELK